MKFKKKILFTYSLYHWWLLSLSFGFGYRKICRVKKTFVSKKKNLMHILFSKSLYDQKNRNKKQKKTKKKINNNKKKQISRTRQNICMYVLCVMFHSINSSSSSSYNQMSSEFIYDAVDCFV